MGCHVGTGRLPWQTLSCLAQIQLVRLPASQALLTSLVLLALPRLTRVELSDVPRGHHTWDYLRNLHSLQHLRIEFGTAQAKPALWDGIRACTRLTAVAVLHDHGPTATQIGAARNMQATATGTGNVVAEIEELR